MNAPRNQFPGGVLVIAGANSAAELKSQPVRDVLEDEVAEQRDPAPVVVEIRCAWWGKWYLVALVAFARLHGAQPDPDKAVRLLCRWAMQWRIPPGKWQRL